MPGKSSGAFAFSLNFLVLFLSREKVNKERELFYNTIHIKRKVLRSKEFLTTMKI